MAGHLLKWTEQHHFPELIRNFASWPQPYSQIIIIIPFLLFSIRAVSLPLEDTPIQKNQAISFWETAWFQWGIWFSFSHIQAWPSSPISMTEMEHNKHTNTGHVFVHFLAFQFCFQQIKASFLYFTHKQKILKWKKTTSRNSPQKGEGTLQINFTQTSFNPRFCSGSHWRPYEQASFTLMLFSKMVSRMESNHQFRASEPRLCLIGLLLLVFSEQGLFNTHPASP